VEIMAKKKVKKKHAGGAPSKYKKEYNTLEYLQGYFDQCKERKELISLCGLAVYIGVCEETLQEWGRVHSEFSVSMGKIKQMSCNMLANGGLNKTYDSRMARFLLSANHGLREGTDITSAGESITIKLPTKFKDI
jgi:hypothetical protein